jgi:hypothetical protein
MSNTSAIISRLWLSLKIRKLTVSDAGKSLFGQPANSGSMLKKGWRMSPEPVLPAGSIDQKVAQLKSAVISVIPRAISLSQKKKRSICLIDQLSARAVLKRIIPQRNPRPPLSFFSLNTWCRELFSAVGHYQKPSPFLN